MHASSGAHAIGGRPTTPAAVPVTAPAQVSDLLRRVRRTEDVRFAPDNARLVISAFDADSLVLVDVDVADTPSGPAVTLRHATELTAPGLASPHGVDFLDDDTVLVANRDGRVTVHPLPPRGGTAGASDTCAVPTVQADTLGGLRLPGSVRVTDPGSDAAAVFVCDNGASIVTRHAVTSGPDGARVGPGTPILRRWFEIPDGVAVSGDGRWIAVSNHVRQCVMVYGDPAGLDERSEPVAVLRGLTYPHGLAFTPDGRHLVVADAGRPYVHVFTAGPDGWFGAAYPAASHRVMDDATFRAGRDTPQEGGPKGLDLDRSGRVVAITSTLQPLAFFALDRLVDDPGEAGPALRLDAERERLEQDAVRGAAFDAALERAAAAVRRLALTEQELQTESARVAAYEQTKIMRLTHAARRWYGRIRRRATRPEPHPHDEGAPD